MKTMTKQVSALLLSLAGLTACSATPAKSSQEVFRLRCQVTDRSGGAIAKAKVTVEGRTLGDTDAQGVISTELHGREGQAVRVNVQCPKGYKGAVLPESVRLTKMRGLDDAAASPSTLVEAICESELRNVVVVVQTKGGNALPVRVGTEPAGVTDAQGNAQILVRLDRDHTGIEVGLDTEARPELLPRNPSRTFSIGQNDAIVVYSEQLTVEKPKVRVLVPRVKNGPLRPRPIRLD